MWIPYRKAKKQSGHQRACGPFLRSSRSGMTSQVYGTVCASEGLKIDAKVYEGEISSLLLQRQAKVAYLARRSGSSAKMGSLCTEERTTEVRSCAEDKGSDESDADKQHIAETFSQYQTKCTTFQATVTVRQLCSEGISFQLWPTASAMCLFIEKEFGEGGMSTIFGGLHHLQRDVTRWDRSYAGLEKIPILGERLSEGSENNVALDNSLCSVLHIDVGVATSSACDERPGTNSNGRLEARVLQGIERALPSRDIGAPMDPVCASLKPNRRKTQNCSARIGAHVLDEFETLLSLEPQSGNLHIPTRRMRVLELGSGTGMVGIVAACFGAQVLLTDLPHVIANISYNLDVNRSVIAATGGSAEARVLRWGVEEDVNALGELSFDLILASDCLYHDTAYKPFLQTLNWLIALGMDPIENSMDRRKLTIPKRMSSSSLSQQLEPAVCLSSLSEKSMSDTVATDPDVNHTDNGQHSASQIDSRPPPVVKPALSSAMKERVEKPAGHECAILLGHMKRWKKDSHFFSMASKYFDIDIVHRHPPKENARISPIIYRLSSKLNRSSSSVRSLSVCAPSPM